MRLSPASPQNSADTQLVIWINFVLLGRRAWSKTRSTRRFCYVGEHAIRKRNPSGSSCLSSVPSRRNKLLVWAARLRGEPDEAVAREDFVVVARIPGSAEAGEFSEVGA